MKPFANMRVISCGVFFYTLCELIHAQKFNPCPELQLQHGKARPRTRNRSVSFSCNSGYILAGEHFMKCENGIWVGTLPKCVQPTCVKVYDPPNVLMYPTHLGSVLNFYCKPGFTLQGNETIYCVDNKWDNNIPTCIVETPKSPSLSCDFESVDLCGWHHDFGNYFEWTQKNFKTDDNYPETGPSYDHTKGVNNDGHYLFIESSWRYENDISRLLSPIYDKMNDGNVCFEFYYHMYGKTTGQLRVYLKKLSESSNLDPKKAFFWKSGNQGDVWLHSLHNLGKIDESFQIVIDGVNGKSHYSDIAIDDVRIIPNCTHTNSRETTKNPL